MARVTFVHLKYIVTYFLGVLSALCLFAIRQYSFPNLLVKPYLETYGLEASTDRRSLLADDVAPPIPESFRTDEDDPTAGDLYEMWSLMYGLDETKPPKTIPLKKGWIDGQNYPLAPHMEDCESLTKKRKSFEERGKNGELPDWLSHDNNSLKGVHPPWVQGSDEDNLALTRRMQAFLWEHQNPPDCEDPNLKFAVVDWGRKKLHGLGSILHVFAALFAQVMDSDRILVPKPGTFGRALHKNCTGSYHGSLTCYFFPFVSYACEKRALYLLSQQQGKNENSNASKLERLQSTANVVEIQGREADGWKRNIYWHSNPFGSPWESDLKSVELLGSVFSTGNRHEHHFDQPKTLKASWWRAQVIRYMLRWPSKKMCHVTNIVRQKAYGKLVAKKIVESLYEQRKIQEVEQKTKPKEAAILDDIRISNVSLEMYSWTLEKPFIPRPILSVHVRQGDKWKEMRVFSFSAYMYLAERLRRHVPDIKTVWLSTEMQSVVDETAKFPTWNFLFSKVERQSGKIGMRQYEKVIGEGRLTSLSFANLIISAECDYFVGVLGSNWNRLINELRMTGGKLNAGYLALNFDEY